MGGKEECGGEETAELEHWRLAHHQEGEQHLGLEYTLETVIRSKECPWDTGSAVNEFIVVHSVTAKY